MAYVDAVTFLAYCQNEATAVNILQTLVNTIAHGEIAMVFM